MEVDYINIGITLGGLVLANATVKAVRVYPLLKNVFKLIKDREEAKKDGKLTISEKAKLYDDIVSSVKEAWLLLKGLLPNKSKN